MGLPPHAGFIVVVTMMTVIANVVIITIITNLIISVITIIIVVKIIAVATHYSSLVCPVQDRSKQDLSTGIQAGR